MKNITLLIDNELYKQIDERVKQVKGNFDHMIMELIKLGLNSNEKH